MKGLELSELFFEEHRSVLEGYCDIAAAGLFGPGSECFGFDDEISRDHDFSADFYILIPQSEDARAGVPLARAYNALPDEFLGVKREKKSALGFLRGVMTVEGFFRSTVGSDYGPESIFDWLYTPSYALAAASNGRVFFDGCGKLTHIRQHILHGMPEDVRRKKLAARAAGMAQSGQYNYERCIKHGEKGAAALALAEFAGQAAEMIYLLNKKHKPFYKWCFKGMDGLGILGNLKEKIEALFEGNTDNIELICADVIRELDVQGLSFSKSTYLENHAFEIMKRIENRDLSCMHVMEG